MAKTYRAITGFRCPANPESMKKHLAALKMEPGGEKDALVRAVEWMDVEEGDKVEPYNDTILKSWLANEAVEEVKARG